MLSEHAHRRLSFIVASLAFAACSLFSILTYQEIVRAERPNGAADALVHTGFSRYRIMAGPKCVGEFTTDLSPSPDGLFLKSSGTLDVAAFGRRFPFAFDIKAGFNSLGQLGASGLKVSGPDISAEIQTSEIHPIKLRYRSIVNGVARAGGGEITGPISIEETKTGVYVVRYPQVQALQFTSASALSQPLLKGLALTVEPAGPEGEVCPDGIRSRLDLSAVITGASALLRSFLPQGFLR